MRTPHPSLTHADMYTPILGQAPLIDPIVAKLQKKIEAELKFQQELIKLGGAMEMTLAQVGLYCPLPFPVLTVTGCACQA